MRGRVNKRGVAIIAAITFIVLISILCLSLASMLGATSRGSLDYLRSAQAFGIAQGGMNWYMRYLVGISDWTSATAQNDIALGQGSFDVAINSQTQRRISFTVTGKVSGSDGATIKRTMSQTALELPTQALFGIFWGYNNADTQVTSSTFNTDMWAAGNVIFQAGTTYVNGTVYHPTGTSVTNASEQVVAAPVPTMPVINTTYYIGLRNTWDGYIPSGNVGQTSGSDITLTSNQVWTGTINSYRDITTNGYNITCNGCTVNARTINLTGDSIFQGTNPTVNLRRSFSMQGTSSINATNFTIRLNQAFTTNASTPSTNIIQGSGTIGTNYANAGAIALNTVTSGTRSLTVTPSGGTITFSSLRGLTVGGTSGSNSITINPGANFYGRGDNRVAVTFNNNATTVNGAFIIGEVGVTVQNGADILNSTLFVNYPGSANSNSLTITGSGTVVGNQAIGPCTVISIGQNSGALTVSSNATVRGFLYQYDSANAGATSLNRATIIGTVIANQFASSNIGNTTITYDQSAIPDPPPQGFSSSSCVQETSWDGN